MLPTHFCNHIRPDRRGAGTWRGCPIDTCGFVGARALLLLGPVQGPPGAHLDINWGLMEADTLQASAFKPFQTTPLCAGDAIDQGLSWLWLATGAPAGRKRFMCAELSIAGDAEIVAGVTLELYRQALGQGQAGGRLTYTPDAPLPTPDGGGGAYRSPFD